MPTALEESWAPFEAVVATSHPVDKYGGVALADSALMQIVDALNSGKLPMIGHHDWTKPVRTKDLKANLVTLQDGERAVRVSGLVDRADWEAVGNIRGMSFSTFEALGHVVGLNPDAPPLKLAADAGWFTDAAISQACSIMSELSPVEGARLLQFTAIDDARVILEMSCTFIASLGPGLATSAIWDGMKYLLSHRVERRSEASPSTTRIELVTPLTSGEVIGIIDSADAATVSRALATYASAVKTAADSAAPGRQVVEWAEPENGGQWTPPA